MLDIYTWCAGSLSSFARPFKENEVLYNQARTFWRNLEGCSVVLIILSVLVSILLAWFYYIPFNNQPGRHYKPSCWLGFLITTGVAIFCLSLGAECLVATPKLDGAFLVELKIAILNGVYSLFIFVVLSFIICKCCTTNAYPFYKIFSK